MSFKFVIFSAVVFTCQVNAQLGIIRPFATGFTNGLTEMAKPFVQLGQSVMSPATEYLPDNRRPLVSQWMSYPSQMIPQAQPQAGAYEGFEALTSGVPGASYFQAVRPPSVFKPQAPYYQIPTQPGALRPLVPYPAPAPAPAPSFPSSSSSEESVEIYRPSNFLIKPSPIEVEDPKIEESMLLGGKIESPIMQRPLPIPEDQE